MLSGLKVNGNGRISTIAERQTANGLMMVVGIAINRKNPTTGADAPTQFESILFHKEAAVSIQKTARVGDWMIFEGAILTHRDVYNEQTQQFVRRDHSININSPVQFHIASKESESEMGNRWKSNNGQNPATYQHGQQNLDYSTYTTEGQYNDYGVHTGNPQSQPRQQQRPQNHQPTQHNQAQQSYQPAGQGHTILDDDLPF